MTWFAIRTVPGAQKPQREYAVEPTTLDKNGRPRGKGYHIVPSLNQNISAVERALSEGGFTYYMPSEHRLVRDRRRTDLWKRRRFALMVGYVFVREPADWMKLLETPGVAGVVANEKGEALPIRWNDILTVRAAEADAEAVFDRQVRNARALIRRKAKHDPKFQALVEALDIAGTISVPLHDEALAA